MSQSTSTMSPLETVSSRKASDIVIAYTILRLSFGANILLHGLSRVLNGRAALTARRRGNQRIGRAAIVRDVPRGTIPSKWPFRRDHRP